MSYAPRKMRGGKGDDCDDGLHVKTPPSSPSPLPSLRRRVFHVWSKRMQSSKTSEYSSGACEASVDEQSGESSPRSNRLLRSSCDHAGTWARPCHPLPPLDCPSMSTLEMEPSGDALSTCTPSIATPSYPASVSTPSAPSSSSSSSMSALWSWSRVLHPTRSRRFRQSLGSPRTDDTVSMCSSTACAYSPATLCTGTTQTTVRSASDVPETRGFPFPNTPDSRDKQLATVEWTKSFNSPAPSPLRPRPALIKSAAIRQPFALPPIPDAPVPDDTSDTSDIFDSSDSSSLSSLLLVPGRTSGAGQRIADRERAQQWDEMGGPLAHRSPSLDEHCFWYLEPSDSLPSFSTGEREGGNSSSSSVEWRSGDLSSRFSDWTPTPSTCSLVTDESVEEDMVGDEWPGEGSPAGLFAPSAAPAALVADVSSRPSSSIDGGEDVLLALREAERKRLEQVRAIAARHSDRAKQLCVGGRAGRGDVEPLACSRQFSTGEVPLRSVGVVGWVRPA